jgi:hypothetical protein
MSILSESGLSTTNIYANTLYMPRRSHKGKTKNLMLKVYLGFGANSHLCAAVRAIGRSVLNETRLCQSSTASCRICGPRSDAGAGCLPFPC